MLNMLATLILDNTWYPSSEEIILILLMNQQETDAGKKIISVCAMCVSLLRKVKSYWWGTEGLDHMSWGMGGKNSIPDSN